MALQTYTVTVASGNAYGGGTGNVYYLDGARNSTGPGTISWVQGATLRFNQNDNTNDNHPLIFSSTTSQSDYLTSGVTYYLDGVTTYSNYVNTTNFNAATVRYVEITPSSQTDFYYLCYVHGIGMGGIFDITSTTWGALSWGEGPWSEQGNSVVSVSGISISSSIGNLQSVTGGVEITQSGLNIASSQGTATGGTSVLIENPGPVTASLGVGQVVTGFGVNITGNTMGSSIGAATVDESTLTGEGWGRSAWGEFAWGVNYSVAVTGQTISSALGEETAFADVTVSVSGQSLGLTQGLFSLIGDFGVVVNAAEDQLDGFVGSTSVTADASASPSGISLSGGIGQVVPEPKIGVDVSGIQATFTLGSIALEQTTTESVTGQSATLTIASVGQASEYSVTGSSISSSIGSVTVVGGAGIDVTGIQLTSTITSPNITAWSEIDLGVSNTWTVVDLAA